MNIPITKIIEMDEATKFKFHAARHNAKNQPLDVYVRENNEWRY